MSLRLITIDAAPCADHPSPRRCICVYVAARCPFHSILVRVTDIPLNQFLSQLLVISLSLTPAHILEGSWFASSTDPCTWFPSPEEP